MQFIIVMLLNLKSSAPEMNQSYWRSQILPLAGRFGYGVITIT